MSPWQVRLNINKHAFDSSMQTKYRASCSIVRHWPVQADANLMCLFRVRSAAHPQSAEDEPA